MQQQAQACQEEGQQGTSETAKKVDARGKWQGVRGESSPQSLVPFPSSLGYNEAMTDNSIIEQTEGVYRVLKLSRLRETPGVSFDVGSFASLSS